MIDPSFQSCTVVCAIHGAKHAFDLMWRSFDKWHRPTPLYVCNTGGDDDCAELGRKYATEYVEAPVSHGVAIDLLCSMVKTPYVLVSDSDVEFLAPVVDDMIAEQAFCVSPPDRYGQGSAEYMGFKTYGQPRIDPCCALFQTLPLQSLLNHTSFAFYVSPHQAKHYDTGSMLYHVAKARQGALGPAADIYNCKTPDWLWKNIHHFGSLSWGLTSPEGSHDHEVAIERYAQIQQRLKVFE